MREDIYGQDILLSDAMAVPVAANGDVYLSDGIQTVLQDIRLRLFTPLGGLFYDVDFGSRLIEFVKDENTPATRRAIEAEIPRRLNLEPRIVPETIRAKVVAWDPDGLTIKVSFRLIDETHPFNLVVTATSTGEMVIQDVNVG